jgi:hypothetical protein
MPHIFAQVPFPKAALAVLKAFGPIADLHIDFTELAEQVSDMEKKLGDLLVQMQQAIEQQPPGDEPTVSADPGEDEGAKLEDRDRIDQLFNQAKQDRAAAYELKRELDRLGVFKEYEDRFLDLFKVRD